MAVWTPNTKEAAVQDVFETLFDEAYDGLGCYDPLVCPETRGTLLARLRQQLPENELPSSTQQAYERIRDVLEQVTIAAHNLLSESQQEEVASGGALSAATLAAFNALVAAVPREESGRFVLGG